MQIIKKSNRLGYTVIELLVTLTVVGILAATIMPIFTKQLNMCDKLDMDIELQQQGLFILSFIEGKILESEGIQYIEDISGYNKLYTNTPIKIKKIIFINNLIKAEIKEEKDSISKRIIKGYIFNLTKNMEHNYYKLLYGNGLSGTGTVEFAHYIESIEAAPIPDDKTFVDADGISLKINLINKDNKAVVESTFYFRNKAEIE